MIVMGSEPDFLVIRWNCFHPEMIFFFFAVPQRGTEDAEIKVPSVEYKAYTFSL